MNTTPTPEQIAAAKAWTRSTPDSPITAEQHAALVAYAEANKGTPGLWQWSDAPSHILLAALEAAGADSARLDWLEKAPASTYPSVDPDPAIGLMHFVVVVENNPRERRGHLGKTLREAIDAAASSQLDAKLSNAARKAQS